MPGRELNPRFSSLVYCVAAIIRSWLRYAPSASSTYCTSTTAGLATSGLGRKPCQDGPCGASLRQAMRNAG